MSGAAIHLAQDGWREGYRFTACGMTCAEMLWSPVRGMVPHYLMDAVDDPKAADCKRCLRYAKARKARG